MPILTPEERLGTTLADKYLLEEILGAGGMGVVFGGRHVSTGRGVAIKVLRAEYTRDPEVVGRFLREARVMASLEHPNVVEVLDMGHVEEGIFVVLERLSGETLSQRLRRAPILPEELLEILHPVLDALAEAHERGYVHRDLKPDNLFLSLAHDGSLVPKLLDFGIVKALLESDPNLRTQTGAQIGTPSYMSPEQVRGSRDLGPPSDIWSMGVLIYVALARRHPFPGKRGGNLLAAIATEEPVPLGEAVPDLSMELIDWVHRALHQEPERRPTARELSEGLSQALSARTRTDLVLPPHSRPHSRPNNVTLRDDHPLPASLRQGLAALALERTERAPLASTELASTVEVIAVAPPPTPPSSPRAAPAPAAPVSVEAPPEEGPAAAEPETFELFPSSLLEEEPRKSLPLGPLPLALLVAGGALLVALLLLLLLR